MARWGMVNDLRKCVGCGTCCDVCEQFSDSPCAYSWRRLLELKEGGLGESGWKGRFFLTMSCMHCNNPPCLMACPTGATYSRLDGIVDIKKNLCVGCGACIVACPYRVRSICNEDDVLIEDTNCQGEIKFRDDYIGICTKCNFCIQLVDEGRAKGFQPGKDPEATPLCVRFCISEALCFGDLDDPESKVSKLIRENRTVQLLEELGAEPKTYYILR